MKSKLLIFIMLFALSAGIFNTAVFAANVDRTTTLQINNVPPSFTAGPSDGSSSATTPTNAGSNVTFTSTAHDNNGDQYYLAICKSDAITPNNNAAPTCTAGSWGISTATDSDSQATVTYTTSSGDAENNDWWAFVCDNNSSGLCSSSSQGTGDPGSPFKVNHVSTFGNVKIGPTCGSTAEVPPGNSITTGGGGVAGGLDATFDTDGIVKTDMGGPSTDDGAFGMTIDGNGKIVAVGQAEGDSLDFAVARYNADGSPDNSFSGDGKVVTPVGTGTYDYGIGVAIDNNGKIYVAGSSDDIFAIVSYNSDGTLNTGFDSDGILTIPSGTLANAITIDGNGKIVAVGTVNNNQFIVVRYNANGTPDSTFGGGDGIVTTTLMNWYDIGYSVAIDGNGKIVVGGSSYGYFALARYNTDGSLDDTFDGDPSMPDSSYPGNGKVYTLVDPASWTDTAFSIAIQTDGKIVAVGDTNNHYGIVRYNTDGSLDTTFDTDGKVSTTIGSYNSHPYSVSIQGDGKILAVGYSGQMFYEDFTVVRYNTNGSLDDTFDGDSGTGDGIVVTEIGTGADHLYGSAIDGDGNIIVAGYSQNSGYQDFTVAKYLGGGGGGGGGTTYTDANCVQAAVTDTDTDTTPDTINMYVCDTNSFSSGVCGGTELCSVTGVASGTNAECVAANQVPVPTAHGTYTVYVFIQDDYGYQGTGTSANTYAVMDVAPVLYSYSATYAPSISAGGSDTVPFSVTLTDDNGDNDVTNVAGIFFDPSAVTNTCTASENNCYIASSCTLTSQSTPGSGKTATGTDNSLGADCSVTVWYNANASDWTVEAKATDGNGVTALEDATVALTNPPLQGIDVVEAAITYGTVVIGGTSSGQETSMGNVGNQILDVYVSGTEMTSGSYTIPVAQQKWNHSDSSFNWDASATGAGPYSMVQTPSGAGDATGCLNRNIQVRSDHTTTTTNESIYWKLRIPASQQAGSYSGQNTFATTSSSTCSSGASF